MIFCIEDMFRLMTADEVRYQHDIFMNQFG